MLKLLCLKTNESINLRKLIHPAHAMTADILREGCSELKIFGHSDWGIGLGYLGRDCHISTQDEVNAMVKALIMYDENFTENFRRTWKHNEMKTVKIAIRKIIADQSELRTCIQYRHISRENGIETLFRNGVETLTGVRPRRETNVSDHPDSGITSKRTKHRNDSSDEKTKKSSKLSKSGTTSKRTNRRNESSDEKTKKSSKLSKSGTTSKQESCQETDFDGDFNGDNFSVSYSPNGFQSNTEILLFNNEGQRIMDDKIIRNGHSFNDDYDNGIDNGIDNGSSAGIIFSHERSEMIESSFLFIPSSYANKTPFFVPLNGYFDNVIKILENPSEGATPPEGAKVVDCTQLFDRFVFKTSPDWAKGDKDFIVVGVVNDNNEVNEGHRRGRRKQSRSYFLCMGAINKVFLVPFDKHSSNSFEKSVRKSIKTTYSSGKYSIDMLQNPLLKKLEGDVMSDYVAAISCNEDKNFRNRWDSARNLSNATVLIQKTEVTRKSKEPRKGFLALSLAFAMTQLVFLVNEKKYKKNGLVPRSFLFCGSSAKYKTMIGTDMSKRRQFLNLSNLVFKAPEISPSMQAKTVMKDLIPLGFGKQKVEVERMVAAWKVLEQRDDLPEHSKQAILARVWQELTWSLKDSTPEAADLLECSIDIDYACASFEIDRCTINTWCSDKDDLNTFLKLASDRLVKALCSNEDKLFDETLLSRHLERKAKFVKADITNKPINFLTNIGRGGSQKRRNCSYGRIPSCSDNHIFKVCVEISNPNGNGDDTSLSDREFLWTVVDKVVEFMHKSDDMVSAKVP